MDNSNFSLFSPFNKSFTKSMLQCRVAYSRFDITEDLKAENSLRSILARPKVGLAIANAKLDHDCENLMFAVRSLNSSKAQRLRARKVSSTETIGSLTIDVSPVSGSKEAKTKKSKKSFDELVGGFDLRTYREQELLDFSDSQILELATERKDDALALQLFIDDCSQAVLTKMASVAGLNLNLLLSHPTGNFVVQKLIKKDSEFAELVSFKCKETFHELAKNEFSSRVMQCLIESIPSFRKHVLQLFRDDLDSYIQSFSSAFLVSVAIRHADTDAERDIIRTTLRNHPKRWLTKKYFKRVLVAYISSCSEQALHGLYKLLTSVLKPYDFFRDRYSCLTLLTFIERSYKPASDLVAQCIDEKPFDLFRWSVFRYFLEHVTENDKLTNLQKCIHQQLVAIPLDSMRRISENDRTHTNYTSALKLVSTFATPYLK